MPSFWQRGGLYASMWNRQREAQEARERLALIADENEAPNRDAAAGRRCAGDAGRGGMIEAQSALSCTGEGTNDSES